MEEIHPGDLVWFAPGEKHWHGQSESKTCARWVPVPICSVIRLTVQAKFIGGKCKSAEGEKKLHRVGQYARRCEQWVLSGVRDMTVTDAFNLPVLGPSPTFPHSQHEPDSAEHKGYGPRFWDGCSRTGEGPTE